MHDCAEHSVTPRYSQAIVQMAERLGIALPASIIRRLSGVQRVPIAWQDELWEAFCSASDDPLIGLKLGLEIQVGHLDSLGMLLVTCDTFGEALEELIEYAPVIGDGGEFRLHRTDGQAFIDYEPHLSIRRAERVEAVLGSMLNLSRWATGGRFQPSGIWLAHAPLAEVERYAALVGCPVHFNAGCNHLGFAADQLELQQIQANGALRDHLRRLADQTLAELGHHSLSAEVQRLVTAHPRWGKERVAEQLHLSGRHLNRRLAEEGLSFKTLRESVLQAMACEALRGDQRVADIAEQLGFSDENAFIRAFRRWQGVTPARFRTSLQNA
ncbi:AraC family transcriptional regulator [Halopseudomonas nanhaiensis]|uniref:AraC family transcriptional regulator n=1 Tax=Halopseudomonas nanhaiensis TaxID=2830842 RepID=UPI001CBEF8C6|nr:AraC family transcriptional regulator [Halopseudomonas nanhaiensis]UAW98456.1 AraC family transcriptional regulator [Halopseudomonas nanhaiensis]